MIKKPRMEEEMGKGPLVFAYYVSGHGFGHATRVAEVVRNLILEGHEVHVVTGAPAHIFTTEIQSPKLFIRKVLLDIGAVQADALTVDRLASLEKYVQIAVVPRTSILSTEVQWLKSINASLVVSDVVPIACQAAAEAGVRAVCVTNFRRIIALSGVRTCYPYIHRACSRDIKMILRGIGTSSMPNTLWWLDSTATLSFGR